MSTTLQCFFPSACFFLIVLVSETFFAMACKGGNMTSIEPTSGAINDVCVFHDSGLMLLALDNSQIPAYFIPALGPAPKWCSHLDNLTV